MSSSHPPNANFAGGTQASRYRREKVLSSELCGCFYCGKTFSPAEITDWTAST